MWKAIRKQAPQLRRWLLDVEISAQFLQTKHAPHSDFKDLIIATEEAKTAGLDTARDLLEEDSPLFNSDYICSSPFLDRMVFEGELPIQGRAISIFFKNLGFMKSNLRPTIEGKQQRLWVRPNLTKAQILKIIESY